MIVPYKKIPTWDNGTWTTTTFNSQKEFGNFLLGECFKEPGEYEFNESTKAWNQVGKYFEDNQTYTHFPENSLDYEDFWDQEELKNRLGVIWKDGKHIWYLTRDYYFFLNYCPVTNKEKGQTETFISIRDVQYHMALYEKIAELKHLHSVILKRRQMLFSNQHVAKSINFLWFENKKTIKWFASDDAYLNEVNGSWKILNAFKNHLNINTPWFKVFSPDKYPEIQQKEKIKIGGKWLTEGNESTLVAKTLKRDPTAGVGGTAFWVWHEEGGIAPKSDITLQYLNPALESGIEKVGSFCIGGSVGDLDDCKPLENFIKYPETYEFLAVPTKLWDETEVEKMCGLFIPAQYGMPQAVDEFGNSLVEEALKLLDEAEEQWKKLPADQYILRKSQNPRNIKEAFAWRKTSYFPVQKIERRQETIKIRKDSKEFKEIQGLLYEDKDGKIQLKKLSDMPNNDRPEPIGYPVDKKQVDKRGCVTIWEYPKEGEKNLYYAGVDSIDANITETSDSIFSMHIYKRGCKKVHIDSFDKQTISYEKGRIVASYRGRFNDTDETNEQGLLLLRLYNALAACERNRPNFINHCRRRGYSSLIARKSDLPFDKDLDITGTKNDEFGVYSDSQGKLLDRLKKGTYEYINMEVDTVHKKDAEGNIGEVVKTFRGLDIIDDYWLLEELKLWNEEGNFDAFISASLAIALGTSRELDYEKTVTIQEAQPEKKNIKPEYSRSLLPSNYKTRTKRSYI